MGVTVSIEECNNKGWTALHFAAGEGCFWTARLLLERGANVNALNSLHRTPLHLAAQNSDIVIIRLLVDGDAALEARNTDGWTPLYLAVWSCQEIATALLLRLGSDWRTRADDGTTLLDAVGRGLSLLEEAERHTRVRELLMQAGCTEETGRIPLENEQLPERVTRPQRRNLERRPTFVVVRR